MSIDAWLILIVGGGALLYALFDEVRAYREEYAEDKQHEIARRAAEAKWRQGLDLREADQRGMAK